MTNALNSFGIPRRAVMFKYGGRIAVGDGGNLQINFGADAYVVTAGGSLKVLPDWPAGKEVMLRFEGATTIVNSTKLAVFGAADFVTGANDMAICQPLGVAGWLIYPIPASPASWRTMIGANNAGNLNSGTIPDARVSATLAASQAFRQGNILAAVSQAAGVPTGGLIERGSNGNGEYVRFADGLQICTFNGSATSRAITTGLGNLFHLASPLTRTFAAAFVAGSIPIVLPSMNDPATSRAWPVISATLSNTAVSIDLLYGSSVTVTVGESYLAAGRWF